LIGGAVIVGLGIATVFTDGTAGIILGAALGATIFGTTIGFVGRLQLAVELPF